MPAAPRSSKKAKAIVYSILGKPASMQKRTKKQQEIDKQLNYQALARLK